MINTKQIGNGLQARYDALLEDPVNWALMRNIAYASIRDDVEKVIKDTNENSADVFINAENLIQNLKAHKINQYVEAGRLTQEINLGDKGQLNQVLMNTELFQTINIIKKESIIKKIESSIKSDTTLFLNNKYAVIIYDVLENKYKNASFYTIKLLAEYVKEEVLKKYKIISYHENLKDVEKSANLKFRTKPYTYTQNDIFDGQVEYLIYELKPDEEREPEIDYHVLMVIINIEKFKIANDKETRFLEGNVFGKLIGDRKLLSDFSGENITANVYNRGIGKVKKDVFNLGKSNTINLKNPMSTLFKRPK